MRFELNSNEANMANDASCYDCLTAELHLVVAKSIDNGGTHSTMTATTTSTTDTAYTVIASPLLPCPRVGQ